MTETTNTVLAVVRPFGRYAKGELITDAETMQAVMAGGNADKVVRTTVPGASSRPAAADHDAAKEG